MVNNNQFSPNYFLCPGDILEEYLDSNDMNQKEFATRIGKTPKYVNQLLKGDAKITAELALLLESVLSRPANFWMNLESNFRETEARHAREKHLFEHISFLDKFPISQMKKFGWIDPDTKKGVLQLESLLDFFGIASPEAWDDVLQDMNVAFRQTGHESVSHEAICAWLRKGKLDAQDIRCADFDKDAFQTALSESRSFTTLEPAEFAPLLKELFSKAGVAVTFVKDLPKTRTSGAARWLSSNKAHIQIGLRYRTNDHFWFTFFHEAAHILLHSKKKVFVDYGKASNESYEIEANQYSADLLIPPNDFDSFIKNNNKPSKLKVIEFARDIEIAPGIVVGHLQHDGIYPMSWGNDLKRKFEWAN